MNIVINGVNLTEGSTVLLEVPEDMYEDELTVLREGLESRCPGVKFILMQGLHVVGVYDAEPNILQIESD